jgi:NAD-dependent dihydropyrimidine dehydrogenase PreA subunit
MGFKVAVDKEKCNGCEECLQICTCDVFEMRNGKYSPVEVKNCIGCQSCVDSFEQHAITLEETGVQMSDTCMALLKDIL